MQNSGKTMHHPFRAQSREEMKAREEVAYSFPTSALNCARRACGLALECLRYTPNATGHLRLWREANVHIAPCASLSGLSSISENMHL